MTQNVKLYSFIKQKNEGIPALKKVIVQETTTTYGIFELGRNEEEKEEEEKEKEKEEEERKTILFFSSFLFRFLFIYNIEKF